MFSPINELSEVLQFFGEFEWGRGSVIVHGEDDLTFPPFLVWRYKKKVLLLENLIVEAVNSFAGNIDWEIELSGQNWSITPRKAEEFVREHDEFRTDIEAMKAFAGKEPELGKTANQELPKLAAHIKIVVQKGLSSEVM